MIVRFLTLAVVLAFVEPIAARGAVIAWQIAEPLSDNSFVQTQGNAAQSLFLRCDSLAGECKWRLTTRVWIMDGTLRSYDVEIRPTEPAPYQYLSVSETDVAGSPFSEVTLIWENHPTYLSRVNASVPQGQPHVPAGPTIHFLHSYVLTSAAGVAPGTLAQIVAGSTGFLGNFPGGGGGFRSTSFGGNTAFPISGGEWPNPVIHINYVPEPAAALLAAAALLLLTRRRRR